MNPAERLELIKVKLAKYRPKPIKPAGLHVAVCPSNIGSPESMRMESAPFASVGRTVMMRVREHLHPELVGRFSEIVVFARFDYITQRAICENMIAAELARLDSLGHAIEVRAHAVEYLVRVGYHRSLGAHPMRGAVERHLQELDVSKFASYCRSLLAGDFNARRRITP